MKAKRWILILLVLAGLVFVSTSVSAETYRSNDGRYVLTVSAYGGQVHYQIDDNVEKVCLSSDNISVVKNSDGTFSVGGQKVRTADQAFSQTIDFLKRWLARAAGAATGYFFAGPYGFIAGGLVADYINSL
jgi:hypothetical protein